MGKIIKVMDGNEKATEIFDKIWYGQIMLEKLKDAVKEGKKNIKELRVELKKLTDEGYYPQKESKRTKEDILF